MAHEIRNPLGGISAGMDYLRRGGRLGSEELESVDVIQQEVLRLDQIIRNLFQVARPAQLQLLESDAAETVERACRSLRKWADERGVGIKITAPELLPRVRLDRDQIHQVLINLIKNAVEASPPGKDVELVVQTVSDSAQSPLEGDTMLFEVLDQGSGIASEDIPQLFEPFFSRKPEGTGLGLFVCHSIVQRHGGALQASSIPGARTSFRMHLPLVPALVGGRK
jgi:signal transduction histidine kinase